MSMVIQHNIPALQTYNIVNNTSNALQKSIAKLSSGLRINSAADDAAGLAISEKMRSQVRGLDRAVANTQDGISLIQTAEGALQETHSILQRMRELSVQAANDTLTQQDRSYIQEEVDQLKEEITRIGNTTQFNKKKLLNGDSSALWSSSDLETKAIINGGLRDVDQFGQKKSVEGNYKIRVKAEPGQAEVQKSDIMTIKHPNVLTDKVIKADDGIKDVEVDNMTPGDYTLQLGTTTTTAANTGVVTGAYGIGGTQYTKNITASSAISSTALTTAPTAAQASTEDTWVFELGNETLGEITVTNVNPNYVAPGGTGTSAQGTAMALTDIAAAIEAQSGAIRKAAHDLGVTLDGSFSFLGGATTAAGSLSMTKFGDSDIGDLKIYRKADANKTNLITGQDNAATVAGTASKKTAADVFTVSSTTQNDLNGSILFEVTSSDFTNKSLTVKATATMMDQNGKNSTATQDNIVLTEGANAINLSDIFGGSQAAANQTVTVQLNSTMFDAVNDNGKFVAFVTAGTSEATSGKAINVNLSGEIDKNWDDTWDGGPLGGETVTYHLNGESLGNTEINFKNYLLNEKTGTVSEGAVKLITDNDFSTRDANATAGITEGKLKTNSSVSNADVLASFTSSYIGKVAQGDVKLRDLDKFWNSEGTFMFDDAKTLTLNQGDGKTASITLYANDTLDEVATKINNAIATDLGQSKYVDDATKFATFVSKASDNSEAVKGTFVIRSVVPGKQGEITFSGDENVINALSLNNIQESKETVYNVDVFDEHTGKVLAQNVKTTGNVMYGVIHPNVDVEFSALTGIQANWNENLNKYTYTATQEESTLHIADNTTVLQIGANEGEDLAMDIGDMRAHSLGLDGVNVMSHERAGRSITVIDNAIDKVSTQRAKLGAYQNRLEYTASNLTTASENLTSAESRIRDADMAKEMMNFTKLNIMLQAGNSMLAQANQQPQNVLSLIR